MLTDFWADYYFHNQDKGVEEFESDGFDEEVAAMMNDDSAWEDVP